MDVLKYALKIFDDTGPTLEKFKKNAGQVPDSIGGKFSALVGGPIALAVAGIAGVGLALKKALDASGEMEKFSVQFGVLLGSTGEAKQRMQELAEFAKKTPFELPEVAQASKTLQTLTKGALSTGDGLTLVGDAAAAAGVPFSDMSVTMGRLYAGLQSGRPIGEAASRLQELGLLSSDARTQLENLQKEGKKGPEVWAVAAKEFGQFSGMMDEQSNTFEGVASTLSDSVNMSFATFGEEILPIAKDIIKDVTLAIEENSDTMKNLGYIMSGVLTVAQKLFQAFVVGINIIKVAVSSALSYYFQFMSKFYEGTSKVIDVVGKYLPETVTNGLKSVGEGIKKFADENSERFDKMSDDAIDSTLRSVEAFNNFSKEAEKLDKKKPKQAVQGEVAGISTQELKKANDARLKLHDEFLKATKALELDSQTDEIEKKRIQTEQEFQEKLSTAQESFKKIKNVTLEDQQKFNAIILSLEASKEAKLIEIDEEASKKKLQIKLENLNKEIQAQEVIAKKARDIAEKTTQDYKRVWGSVSNKLESTLSAPFEGFLRNVIRGNQSLLTTFKQLFSSIISGFGNMLIQMLAQYAAKAAVFALLNTFTGGTFGTVMPKPSFFANGTSYSPGNLAVVGERGPELINLPRGSQVTPLSQISNNSSANYTVNINGTNLGVKEISKVVTANLRTIQKQNSYRRL